MVVEACCRLRDDVVLAREGGCNLRDVVKEA